MRDPSIHITKKKFESILSQLEVSYFPIDQFFLMARKNSIDSRAVLIKNKKDIKKASNIILAKHGDASMAADILYSIRVKLKHRGVQKIKEGTANWAKCRELADICNEFCRVYDLETRSGFITYMETGIKLLKNSRNILNSLVTQSEYIFTYYDSYYKVSEYMNNSLIKQEVEEIHNYYIGYIAKYTGIYESFMDNPEKVLHICKLRDILKENNWDYREYINAQFDALSFCNGIPSIENMYKPKAIERFNKYLYKNNYTPSSDDPVIEGGLWSKIKN